MKKKSKSLKQAFRDVKIIVEKHPDTYVAYPLGIKGSCVGQGDSYDEALACVKEMLKSHIKAFGPDVFEDDDSPIQQAFVAETRVSA